jgi:hypothetical protein
VHRSWHCCEDNNRETEETTRGVSNNAAPNRVAGGQQSETQPGGTDHGGGSSVPLSGTSSIIDAEALLAKRIFPPQYRRLSKGVWVPQLQELKKQHGKR